MERGEVGGRAAPVDNRLPVETPEGVIFELELAGFLPRAGAYLVDGAIRMGSILIMVIPLSELGFVGEGIFWVLLFVMLWVYYPFFELNYGGRSPGKRVFGVRVVNRDGTPVGWYGSLIRNLLRTGDILPFGYVIGSISMLGSGRFQRLGDLAADTVVVYERQAFGGGQERVLPPAEPLEVGLPLLPEEQEGIVAFAERSYELGEPRSRELAGILGPLVEAADEEEARQKVLGLAQRVVRWG